MPKQAGEVVEPLSFCSPPSERLFRAAEFGIRWFAVALVGALLAAVLFIWPNFAPANASLTVWQKLGMSCFILAIVVAKAKPYRREFTCHKLSLHADRIWIGGYLVGRSWKYESIGDATIAFQDAKLATIRIGLPRRRSALIWLRLADARECQEAVRALRTVRGAERVA